MLVLPRVACDLLILGGFLEYRLHVVVWSDASRQGGYLSTLKPKHTIFTLGGGVLVRLD